MAALGIEITKYLSYFKNDINKEQNALKNPILFIVPLLIIMIVIYAMFQVIKGDLPADEYELFSNLFLASTITALMASAGMQIITSRISGDAMYFKSRKWMYYALKNGCIITMVILLLVMLASFPVFLHMGLGYETFFWFVSITLLLGISFIILSTFWALEKYSYIAIGISSGFGLFAAVIILFAGLMGVKGVYAGSLLGAFILISIFSFLYLILIRKSFNKENSAPPFYSIREIFKRNKDFYIYNSIFIGLLFFDKIFTVIYCNVNNYLDSSEVPNYITLSFIGMVPSIIGAAVVVIFWSVKKKNLKQLYKGTIKDIESRINDLNFAYSAYLIIIALASFISFIFVFIIYKNFIPSRGFLMEDYIVLTISLGSIFFVLFSYSASYLFLIGMQKVVATLSIAGFAVLCVVSFGGYFVFHNVFLSAIGYLVATIFLFVSCHCAIRHLSKRFAELMFAWLE